MTRPKPPSDKRPSWDALYQVATAQAGHFTARQAAEVGFSAQLLFKHIQNGNISRPARAIYRISRFPPTEHGDLVVLRLAFGEDAVFSHETALRLHDLSDAFPGRIHLTVPAEMRSRKHPDGVVVHYGVVPSGDRQWLGPVSITTPRRTLLDVAAAHGDASLVAQAIDQGIRRGMFATTEVAAATAYVAAAQGWTAFLGGGLLGGGWKAEDLGDNFWARPFMGLCTVAPPTDWPFLAAELGLEYRAFLRVAQYFPNRTMHVEFAWEGEDPPDGGEIRRLRKRLAARFTWA